jgi:hypothetical protein
MTQYKVQPCVIVNFCIWKFSVCVLICRLKRLKQQWEAANRQKTDNERLLALIITINNLSVILWKPNYMGMKSLNSMNKVKQEMLTLPDHLSSYMIFTGFHFVQCLVFCVVFCRSLFVLFLLAISLSVFCRFAASHCYQRYNVTAQCLCWWHTQG